MEKIKIGVFGGSGFYSLLEKAEEIEINTPYGKPSAKITIGEYAGKKIAFLPRHGEKHQYPPHKIPYRANIRAFKELGVERIIGPSAAGSLQPGIKPGDFVVCDQFIDRTWGREDTFFDGPKVAHISGAHPYCPELRKLAIDSCRGLEITTHDKGAVVVINGPRFSTTAESRWFSSHGWEVINMTQYPEAILAREAEICYVNIALITDFDAGLEGTRDIKPVTVEEVVRVFNENNEKVKKVIFKMIEKISELGGCQCNQALKNAFF
ncbi:methylthioadenosine phosphorylase [Candidatus Jorgensenbacteria bacterium RIFCSPLOWO2_12_FULL_42_11]|uniref:S-methyl-5'-thioadenosine phosphorylase n=1 Tax=Candidatus Jorgensenbacteria bacterium RIFCSPLOWO2_12_FULL_42_11 TaxID=1798473 RepID=A0A1F6C103_9BACT|nr:MAG: methylthioadenosine phosphorylase [Candidatus Jorgensenbacteria bacterium RIFCSPLOWO2_12_FULL_42_11]